MYWPAKIRVLFNHLSFDLHSTNRQANDLFRTRSCSYKCSLRSGKPLIAANNEYFTEEYSAFAAINVHYSAANLWLLLQIYTISGKSVLAATKYTIQRQIYLPLQTYTIYSPEKLCLLYKHILVSGKPLLLQTYAIHRRSCGCSYKCNTAS